jgi:chorismate-pyruvate lyase
VAPATPVSRPEGAIDASTLAPFQRILLVTDGTVTDILQAYLGEKLSVVKLLQRLERNADGVPDLDARGPVQTLVRHILLRGVRTRKNFIYAESVLLPNRLDKQLRTGLFATQKPLGQLIGEAQLETRREILRSRMERAGAVGKYFGVHARAPMITRTYRVFIARRAVMLITEKFPRALFNSRS